MTPLPCTHADHVPVESLVDDQVTVVARLCLDCDAQLHAGWGCPACEWQQFAKPRRLCDPINRIDLEHVLVRPCREHA